MKERESESNLSDESDQKHGPEKSVLTWKNVFQTIGFMWIPAIVIILILKLAGC
jgi:hypothetical protein